MGSINYPLLSKSFEIAIKNTLKASGRKSSIFILGLLLSNTYAHAVQTIVDNNASHVIDLSASTEPVEVFGNGGNDAITGSVFSDLIEGGTGKDVTKGLDGDDIFSFNGSNLGADTVNGGNGFDQILGGPGNDAIGIKKFDSDNTVEFIDGGTGFNTIVGTRFFNKINLSNTQVQNISRIILDGANDEFTGSLGDDVVDGGTGRDTLNGNDGYDIAIYNGVQSGYEVSILTNKVTVTDIDPSDGDEGKDTLFNMEKLTFSDGEMLLTGDPGPDPDPMPDDSAILTLVKEVVNDDTGTAVDTDFTLTASSATQTITGTEGAASITNVSVDVGAYTLNEGALAGYTLTSLSCTNATTGGSDVSGVSKATPNVTLAANDDVTCTYTNDDQDVVVDPDPTFSSFAVMVTNKANRNVLVWDGESGNFIGELFPRGSLTNPALLEIGPDGNLYVVFNGDSRNTTAVQKYDALTGNDLGEFANFSEESDSSIDIMGAITFDPNGDLLVFDNGGTKPNHKAFRFEGPNSSSPGALIDEFITRDEFGTTKRRLFSFDLEFGPDGYLYSSDNAWHSVIYFQGPNDSDPGELVDVFASAFAFSEPKYGFITSTIDNGFIGSTGTLPRGLAWGPDGNLYVSAGELHDIVTQRVLRFSPDGNFIDDFIPHSYGIVGKFYDIDFGPDGNLYVTNSQTDEILVYGDPTGPLAGNLLNVLSTPPDVNFTGTRSITFKIIEQ